MKTYLLDIIPKIKRYSKNLDELTNLTNQNWVAVDDIPHRKKVFIFDASGELFIYEKGIEVESGSWRLVNQSLILKLQSGGYLLKNSFNDGNVLLLKLDSTDGYVLFVNETKYNKEFNNVNDVNNFLTSNYLNKDNLRTKHKTKKEFFITKTKVTENPIIDFEKPFNINDFTNLKKDIKTIKDILNQIDKECAVDIIISFTRDHTIKSEWIKSNPTVNNLVTKKKIPLNLMEYIFNKSINYPGFRNDFENYIREQLK
ncbi:MAG: hypothetical protein JJ936_09885 [Psychroserpens sp.]|nr:hypothetical protein [Psychroserpens sp.]